MSFSPVQATGTVFPHLNMPFLPNSKIYLEHCHRGEALITSHLRFSSNEVASHVKQLPFRPLLLLLLLLYNNHVLTHQHQLGVGQHVQLRLRGHLTLTSITQQPHINTSTAGRRGATRSVEAAWTPHAY